MQAPASCGVCEARAACGLEALCEACLGQVPTCLDCFCSLWRPVDQSAPDGKKATFPQRCVCAPCRRRHPYERVTAATEPQLFYCPQGAHQTV